MLERFTDQARKVLALSNQEAQRLQHEYIGTEHILLGLVMEGSGGGAKILKNLNIDPRLVRIEVEKLIVRHGDLFAMGKLPQTPGAKKVIEYAIEEARNLGHKWVGTEHLLLGLLSDDGDIAGLALGNLGVTFAAARAEVDRICGGGMCEGGPPSKFDPPDAPPSVVDAAKIIVAAARIAQGLGHKNVSSGHVLLAMIRDPDCAASQAMKASEVDLARLEAEVMKILQSQADKP